MIIPDHYQEKIAGSKEYQHRVENFPIAYAGAFIKYPKQGYIIREWLEKRPKIMVITGWKRVAKTFAGTYIGSSWLLGGINHNWPGAKAMGITQSYNWKKKLTQDRNMIIGGRSMNHVESVLLKEYRELLPKTYIKKWFSQTNHSIEISGMAKANIRTYDQKIEQWKSGKADLIHLDEEPPRNVIEECLDRTKTTKGQIIITVAIDDADVSWLPDACLHPEKFFGTTSFLHFKLGVEDVPTEIYPEEEKQSTYRKYDNTVLRDAVRKGEFGYLSGRWVPEFDPAIHIIKPFKIPPHWLKWRFMDAGTAAPCACAWIALAPNGAMFMYREYYKTRTTIDQRCAEIIEMSGNDRQKNGDMWEEMERTERFMATYLDHHEFKDDPTTGDSLDFHYVKAGLTVQPSTALGQQARRELIRKWMTIDPDQKHFITHKSGAPRFYCFDTCVNFIWEIQKKCEKKTVSEHGGTIEKKVDNKDDHLIDCVEYACSELDNWTDEARTAHKERDDEYEVEH